MKSVVGIDGCKDGWLSVRCSGNTVLEVDIITSLSVLQPLPEVITIDIPIGLVDSGSRTCDLLARRFIGSRRSSVFPAPIRPVLKIEDYSHANTQAKSVHGKGMSQQSFAIMSKIDDIDRELMESDVLRDRSFEVHPEVSFREWFGAEVPFAKKTTEGKALRLNLVERKFGSTAYKDIRSCYLKKAVADDDILDAYASVWTALRILDGTARSFPHPPDSDDTGQRMAIWY